MADRRAVLGAGPALPPQARPRRPDPGPARPLSDVARLPRAQARPAQARVRPAADARRRVPASPTSGSPPSPERPPAAYSDEIAETSLVRQLGKPWTGVHAAAPHVRCLFAAFALQADRQRDDACSYLGDLAVSLPPGNGDVPLALPPSVVAQADRILEDTGIVGRCAEVAARHAYTTTAMMGVLSFTRKRAGILQPRPVQLAQAGRSDSLVRARLAAQPLHRGRRGAGPLQRRDRGRSPPARAVRRSRAPRHSRPPRPSSRDAEGKIEHAGFNASRRPGACAVLGSARPHGRRDFAGTRDGFSIGSCISVSPSRPA